MDDPTWKRHGHGAPHCPLPTGPYTFRRGNGEALDNSSKYPDCRRFSSKLSADIWKGFISECRVIIASPPAAHISSILHNFNVLISDLRLL